MGWHSALMLFAGVCGKGVESIGLILDVLSVRMFINLEHKISTQDSNFKLPDHLVPQKRTVKCLNMYPREAHSSRFAFVPFGYNVHSDEEQATIGLTVAPMHLQRIQLGSQGI
jgi:hypothetical protein